MGIEVQGQFYLKTKQKEEKSARIMRRNLNAEDIFIDQRCRRRSGKWVNVVQDVNLDFPFEKISILQFFYFYFF